MKPQIIITVEGGVIQDVSANVPINYMTIDFDADGADEDKIYPVPQSDGDPQDAVVHDCQTGPDKIIKLVRNLREQIKSRNKS